MEKAELVIVEWPAGVRISLTIPGQGGSVTMAGHAAALAATLQILKSHQLGPGVVDIIAPQWVKAELEKHGFKF